MNRIELLEARRDREVFGNAFYLKTPAGLKRLDPIRVRISDDWFDGGFGYADYRVDSDRVCRIPRRNVLHRRQGVSRFRHWRISIAGATLTVTMRRLRKAVGA